jgi:tetratricopeptide (TPR) repeat protein
MSNSPITEQEIQRLILHKQYDDAQLGLEQLIQSEPENPDALYLLGVLHHMQGRLPDAAGCLRRALDLDPNHTDAAVCLSVLFNDIGRYDDAKKTFEQANVSVVKARAQHDIGINRKFAIKHLELADLYFRYRRYDEAIEQYSAAIHLDGAMLETRIRRAKAYAKKGFVSRALQELQSLKGDVPEFMPARIQLGLLHYSQGNLLDAELEWESILEREPSHREAINYLEMARLERSRGTPSSTPAQGLAPYPQSL